MSTSSTKGSYIPFNQMVKAGCFAPMTQEQREAELRNRSIIRGLLTTFMGCQKQRIQTGNRVIAQFYKTIGVAPSSSPTDAEDTAAIDSACDTLVNEYKLITNVVAAVLKTRTIQLGDVLLGMQERTKEKVDDIIAILNNDDNLRNLAPKSGGGKAFDDLVNQVKEASNGQLISKIHSKEDLMLVESYYNCDKNEKRVLKHLEEVVQSHPLHAAFFSKIVGCGVTTEAYCLGYLDPYSARHRSSFIRYCGLDPVQDRDEEGNPLFVKGKFNPEYKRFEKIDNGAVVRQKYRYFLPDGVEYTGTHKFVVNDQNEVECRGAHDELLSYVPVMRKTDDGEVEVYEEVDTGAEYVGPVGYKEHGRRKGDAYYVQYEDANGNMAWKKSLGYNPVLRSKLLAVFVPNFIKSGKRKEVAPDGSICTVAKSEYVDVYVNYKNSKAAAVAAEQMKAAHVEKMARRQVARIFLENLWVAWRMMLGLEVTPSYGEAHLGIRPHGSDPSVEALGM